MRQQTARVVEVLRLLHVMPCNLTIETAGFYGCSSIYTRLLEVTFKKTASSQPLSRDDQVPGSIPLSLGVLLHFDGKHHDMLANT